MHISPLCVRDKTIYVRNKLTFCLQIIAQTKKSASDICINVISPLALPYPIIYRVISSYLQLYNPAYTRSRASVTNDWHNAIKSKRTIDSIPPKRWLSKRYVTTAEIKYFPSLIMRSIMLGIPKTIRQVIPSIYSKECYISTTSNIWTLFKSFVLLKCWHFECRSFKDNLLASCMHG